MDIVANFKEIHIGAYIEKRVGELDIDLVRICNFLQCSEGEINEMYKKESLECSVLLRWSKLLDYDFFRLYSQHIILYSPPVNKVSSSKISSLPKFRKNIYTKNLIEYILELISSGEKTVDTIIKDYGIPKTTLYKWKAKYDEKNS
ncbi:helix-turn-helix domain-containing protein [Chryseobacterium mucoviscidosis]|uniref:helix-turn-helix domain-containing protein n=1 Tax=Chryseobacterium mucoviscidosis TaxID=1945581 RepID=UPI00301801F0